MAKSKKKKTAGKLKWLPLFIVALLLAGGYGWGASHYSKNSVLNRYLAARSSEGDIMASIKPYVVWADTKDYITMDEGRIASFSPLTDQERQALKTEILEGREGDAVFMTNIGTKFWIFPDYRIAYQPMSLTITTNVADMDVLLNDRQVARSDSEAFSVTVDRLLPADYTASLRGTHKGKAVAVSRDYDGTANTIPLNVTFKTFSVTSNLDKGLLYFWDKEIGQLTDGSYAVEDYPVSDNLEVYVGRTFTDGQLTSKKVAMDKISDGEELELNVDNLLTQEEASPKLLEIFDSLLYFVSTGQDSDQVKDLFEAGSQNGFYDLIKTSVKSKMHTDSRRASSLSISNLYISNFQQIGKETYLVNFAGLYDFYYDKSTDTVKKSRGHLYQNIAGQFTLKKTDGKLVVVNDKNFGLDLVSEDNQITAPVEYKTVSGVPAAAVGTWERSAQGATFYMTISSNGRVETTIVYDDKKLSRDTLRTSISAYKTIQSGYYAITTSGYEALAPDGGLTGTVGLAVSGNRLTTLIWSGNAEGEMDYSSYTEVDSWKKSSGVPKESSSSSSSSSSEDDEEETKTELEDDENEVES